MRLPSESAAPQERVAYGRYVYTRLKRAKLDDLAQNVDSATKSVKDASRSAEDANEPVQEAMARRDSVDDDLDDAAQNARLALASRSLDAQEKAPYKDIFPKGIDYYTAAPMEKEVEVFNELKQRLETHLPAADAVRTTAVPLVDAGVREYAESTSALSAARNAQAIAKTKLDAAEESWGGLMEKTYGALVHRMGKRNAERFFPRRRGKASAEEAPAPVVEPGPQG
jgi:hypothetical protein